MSFAKIEPRQRGLSFFSFLFDKKKKRRVGIQRNTRETIFKNYTQLSVIDFNYKIAIQSNLTHIHILWILFSFIIKGKYIYFWQKPLKTEKCPNMAFVPKTQFNLAKPLVFLNFCKKSFFFCPKINSAFRKKETKQNKTTKLPQALETKIL